MRDIDFVITGMPRGGTMYISELFNRMGIRTGHERYFNWEFQIYKANNPKCFGDVSWLAVPYLNKLPKDTIVLHQIRDPIKTIESFRGYNNPPVMSDERESVKYVAFLREHCSDLYEEEQCEYGRMIRFYYEWHSRIVPYANFTYDVSELADPYFLQELVYKATKTKVGLDKVEIALDTVSPTKHSSKNRNTVWVEQYLLSNPSYKKYIEGGT